MSGNPERLLAGQQVAAKILMAKLAKIAKGGREELEPQIDTDDSVPAYLPNGTRIGKVKRSKVPQRAIVCDAKAFLDFVRQHRPSSVVESVDPEFVAHCLKRLHDTGTPTLADGLVVPGIELVDGSASYTPEPYDSAADEVLRYVAERGWDAVLAIEPGEPQ